MGILIVTITAALMLAWLAPRTGESWIRPIERCLCNFARRKCLVIVALGCLTLVTRLVLLPIWPVPVPAIHDEFSYLLAADTFAHGRLTNPPHPMWIFFDTFHELQHPTYASKYPPAQGASMAVGELLGHPWIGVLLTTGCMTMALTWMLQGWVPPPWALLGGVLAWLHYGIFTYWVDTYYNGSVAMIGAALVLGAYPRLLHSARILDSLRMGIGAAILASSRPFEGFVFCIPVAVALLVKLPNRVELRRTLIRIVLPITGVLAGCFLFLGHYNARVTGNPLLFPYVLYHRQYFNYPIFVWQKVGPPLHYENPQFEIYFNVWHRGSYALTWEAWRLRALNVLWALWYLLLGPFFTVPILMLGWVLKDRRMRLPLTQILLSVAGMLSVVWFQPHYAAPLAAAMVLVLVQALRHLRHASFRNRPVGLGLTRVLVVLALDWVLIQAAHAARYPQPQEWNDHRENIIHRLDSMPGNHLLIVRYAPDHDVHQEWVYNAADIDHSRIVWAREIPGRDLQPLLNYFAGRRVWLLQPDAVPPTLQPYQASEATKAP